MSAVNEYRVDMRERRTEVVSVPSLNAPLSLPERFNTMFENIGDSLNALINHWTNIRLLLCFENMTHLKKYRTNNYIIFFVLFLQGHFNIFLFRISYHTILLATTKWSANNLSLSLKCPFHFINTHTQLEHTHQHWSLIKPVFPFSYLYTSINWTRRNWLSIYWIYFRFSMKRPLFTRIQLLNTDYIYSLLSWQKGLNTKA